MPSATVCHVWTSSLAVGLALALRPAVETIFYAECNMACKAVLVARMNNNDLDTAPICPDVKQLPMKTLVDAKPGMLVAGFPCQDVSTGGKQAGMKGQRSSLVRYVIKAAADLRPLHVLLENVYAIMGVKMRKMLLFIVSQLYRLGYNVSWVCTAAFHAGMHTRRMRWFCLATRSDVLFPRPLCQKLGSRNKQSWQSTKPSGPSRPVAHQPHVRCGSLPHEDAWQHCGATTGAARDAHFGQCAHELRVV